MKIILSCGSIFYYAAKRGSAIIVGNLTYLSFLKSLLLLFKWLLQFEVTFLEVIELIHFFPPIQRVESSCLHIRFLTIKRVSYHIKEWADI